MLYLKKILLGLILGLFVGELVETLTARGVPGARETLPEEVRLFDCSRDQDFARAVNVLSPHIVLK